MESTVFDSSVPLSIERKAELWDQLCATATAVQLPHPNGRIIVERRDSPAPIAPVLTRVLEAIGRAK